MANKYALIISGLFMSIQSFTTLYGQETTTIKVSLKNDQEIQISQLQRQTLEQISETIKNIVEIDPTAQELYLSEVPLEHFAFIINNLQALAQQHELKPLIEQLNQNDLSGLINTANFLDIPFLLHISVDIYASNFVFSENIINIFNNQELFENYVQAFPFPNEISIMIAESFLKNKKETEIIPAGLINIISIAWSPDDTKIAASDVEGNVSIVSATGQQIKQISPELAEEEESQQQDMESVNWNANALTVNLNNKIIFYNPQTFDKQSELEGYAMGTWSPNYQNLAAVSGTKLEIFDSNFSSVTSIEIEKNITSFSWDPTSSFIGFGFVDGSITIYDISGNSLYTNQMDSKVIAIAWLKNEIFAVNTQKKTYLIKNPFNKPVIISFLPSEIISWNIHKNILTTITQEMIELFDTTSDEINQWTNIFRFPSNAEVLAWSHNGNQLATGTSEILTIYHFPFKMAINVDLIQTQLFAYMISQNINDPNKLPTYLKVYFASLPEDIKLFFLKFQSAEKMDIEEEIIVEEQQTEDKRKRHIVSEELPVKRRKQE